jgi:hypothetical protein
LHSGGFCKVNKSFAFLMHRSRNKAPPAATVQQKSASSLWGLRFLLPVAFLCRRPFLQLIGYQCVQKSSLA